MHVPCAQGKRSTSGHMLWLDDALTAHMLGKARVREPELCYGKSEQSKQGTRRDGQTMAKSWRH